MGIFVEFHCNYAEHCKYHCGYIVASAANTECMHRGTLQYAAVC